MAYLVFVFMAACLIQSVSTTVCRSSTVGKEFVFGILDTIGDCCKDRYNIVALDITNASPNDTQVRLKIPYFNNDTYFNIPTEGNRIITIDPHIQRGGSFVEKRGIKVSSNNDISVLVTNAYHSAASIDSYNILPTSNLGNRYILSSHGSHTSGRGGVMMASGVKNNTTVTLMNDTRVLKTAVINAFEVFQFLCSKCDLTGTKVISDKSAFVVSGTAFTQIPASSVQDEYIASEMFPVSTWSYKYIVSPVFPKSAFMLRLISDDPFFSATISNITRSYRLTQSLTEQYFGTEPVVVTANQQFSLTQYGVGYDYDNRPGDPFMTLIPGVDQYLNEYTFSVPHGYYDVKSYVAITVPSIYQNGLVLDGVSMQLFNKTGPIKTLKVPKPFDDYTIFIFSINEGYHHFFHSSSSVKFGVFVYGLGYYQSNGLSYGFYAGFNLKGIDCSVLTSLPTTTNSPTTVTTSTSPPGTGPMCYNCNDLTHIGLCDTVDQCKRNEVCYIERYRESGQMKYISGCLEADKCPNTRNESRYSDALCFECCHGDYCNNNGCGENAIPDRKNRGPICFDCQHVASPDECQHVTPCDSHQGCSIEEFKWFDYSHFKLGCGHVLCHPTSRMGSHVFKRATPVCHWCCTEDYCNQNCTASSQGQTGSIIIG